MHKKMVKAVAGSFVAATMLATSAAGNRSPWAHLLRITALVRLTLTTASVFRGTTCVTNPAQQSFNISGGTYNVTIVNPGGEKRGGDSGWHCQFRHRKLHIEADTHIRLHWEVEASNAGDLATHIASLDG